MRKSVFMSMLLLLLFGCSAYEDDTQSLDTSPSAENDDRYRDYPENPFISTVDYPTSTFSVDADGASYANMRKYVMDGDEVQPASVRIEEYINYFIYDYPEPEEGEDVSMDTEVFGCPWNEDHQLMRIGLKGRYIAKEDLPASNFVLLIDVSGSMNSKDKLGLLKEGFIKMVDAMRPTDRVAIVTYAGKAGVSLESTPCSQKEKIKNILSQLMTKGATAGMAGISRAYQLAEENYIPGGNNRVILGTDGDFNVGVSSTEKLIEMIKKKRATGVHLTVLGVGRGNLNEEMMEQLANNGNGTYEYIDNTPQLQKIFVDERSKFYTVASDCKIQVKFNPEKVLSYRLIGYENRGMKDEHFDDDNEDAGDIGVDQTITALYEVVLPEELPEGEFASVDVRYKKHAQAVSRKISASVSGGICPISEASENSRFASAVTGAGLMFKKSKYMGDLTWPMIADLAEGAKSFDPFGYRADFCRLLQKVY